MTLHVEPGILYLAALQGAAALLLALVGILLARSFAIGSVRRRG